MIQTVYVRHVNIQCYRYSAERFRTSEIQVSPCEVYGGKGRRGMSGKLACKMGFQGGFHNISPLFHRLCSGGSLFT